MYQEIASWWPLLSAPEDYEEEAAFYLRALLDGCARKPRTLLELGSGGGNNASYMKARVRRGRAGRSLARHARGEPRAQPRVRARRRATCARCGSAATFDCVFVHDAVTYMTTEADLRQRHRDRVRALQARRRRALLPGPRARELPARRPTTAATTAREPARAALSRMGVGSRSRRHHLHRRLRLSAARRRRHMRVEHDRHVEGLFARADWLRWLEEAGFQRASPCRSTTPSSSPARTSCS